MNKIQVPILVIEYNNAHRPTARVDFIISDALFSLVTDYLSSAHHPYPHPAMGSSRVVQPS